MSTKTPPSSESSTDEDKSNSADFRKPQTPVEYELDLQKELVTYEKFPQKEEFTIYDKVGNFEYW